MWLAKLIIKEILVKLDLHISTLSYLVNGYLCFIELSDSDIKEN